MTGVIMIQEQDIVVFQGRGDERLALGQSISHPDKEMSREKVKMGEKSYYITCSGSNN